MTPIQKEKSSDVLPTRSTELTIHVSQFKNVHKIRFDTKYEIQSAFVVPPTLTIHAAAQIPLA